METRVAKLFDVENRFWDCIREGNRFSRLRVWRSFEIFECCINNKFVFLWLRRCLKCKMNWRYNFHLSCAMVNKEFIGTFSKQTTTNFIGNFSFQLGGFVLSHPWNGFCGFADVKKRIWNFSWIWVFILFQVLTSFFRLDLVCADFVSASTLWKSQCCDDVDDVLKAFFSQKWAQIASSNLVPYLVSRVLWLAGFKWAAFKLWEFIKDATAQQSHHHLLPDVHVIFFHVWGINRDRQIDNLRLATQHCIIHGSSDVLWLQGLRVDEGRRWCSRKHKKFSIIFLFIF